MLVYLRFASIVTDTGARLTTDLPGWALVGRVSHPLDDSSNFLKVITYFLSTGPALLGRTNCRDLRISNQKTNNACKKKTRIGNQMILNRFCLQSIHFPDS
jgi:hypothetical protein